MYAPQIEYSVGGQSINGVNYDYANPDSWGLRTRAQFKRLGARMFELASVSDLEDREPTAAEDREYAVLVDNMLKMALPGITKATLKGLELGEKEHYLEFFLDFQAVWAGAIEETKSALRTSGQSPE